MDDIPFARKYIRVKYCQPESIVLVKYRQPENRAWIKYYHPENRNRAKYRHPENKFRVKYRRPKTSVRVSGKALRPGGIGLEGHSRGVFSGGEIQRLRRLRQEAHTPTVLVAVSD